MEQQRTFLYLALVFLGFLIWSTWQQDKIIANQPKIDQGISSPVNPAPTANLDSKDIPSVNQNTVTENIPEQKPLTSVNTNLVHVKTDVLDIYINTQGGTLVQSDLLTYPVSLKEKETPVRILNQAKGYTAQSGLIHQNSQTERAPNHYADYKAQQKEYILAEGQNSLLVPLSWQNEEGIKVTKTFTFERGKFNIRQHYQIDNQTDSPWSGNAYMQFTHGDAEARGSILTGVQAYNGGAYYNEKYIKIDFDDMKDEKLADSVTGGWAALIQHYFVSAWVPSQQEKNLYYTNYIAQDNKHIMGVKTPLKTIQAGGSGNFESEFYVGPAIQSHLEKLAHGLELTVDYGIFTFISKPLFLAMNWINKYVGNWGWTIILMTILIKIVFFYPSAVSYRSMAKMKKLSPKIQALNEKYKNDPQAKQKEMMSFYRKEKINPLGGCLPILIQIPVFMGLYWVLLESVELRQAPWTLWYEDLSIKDPFFILPLLMGGSMWIQQKLNPPMMTDPMQQKIFSYLPVVFTVMFLFFPAGLVLYWVVNNVLSIIQQWYITNKIVNT